MKIILEKFILRVVSHKDEGFIAFVAIVNSKNLYFCVSWEVNTAMQVGD